MLSVITEVESKEQLYKLSQTLVNNEEAILRQGTGLFVAIKNKGLSVDVRKTVGSFFTDHENSFVEFKTVAKSFDLLVDSKDAFNVNGRGEVCVVDGGVVVRRDGIDELLWRLKGSFDGVDSALRVNNENPTTVIGDIYKPKGVIKQNGDLIRRSAGDEVVSVDLVDRGLLMFSEAGWIDFDGRKRFEGFWGLDLRRLGYMCGINVGVVV